MNEQKKSMEELLSEHNLMFKEVLSFDEAAIFLNFSKSYLYKLTSGRSIPYYKPQGKKCYFTKTELLAWVLRNRQTPKSETVEVAYNYTTKMGKS
jgi:excisionase family DNA binding protein